MRDRVGSRKKIVYAMEPAYVTDVAHFPEITMNAYIRIAIFTTALLLGLPAHANPTVSSGASESVDQSQSGKTMRERSMSTDHSTSSKASRSRSTDRSREHSHERSRTRKRARDRKTSRDVQTKINVNAMLIQRFIVDYEARGAASKGWATTYFGGCRPFTGINTQFPVLSRAVDTSDQLQSLGDDERVNWPRWPDSKNGIVFMRIANIYRSPIVTRAWEIQNVQQGESLIPLTKHGADAGIRYSMFAPKGIAAPPAASVRDGDTVAGRYIQCRIVAHFAVTAAADELQREQSMRRFTSAADVSAAIDHIYADYITRQSVERGIAREARAVQQQIQQCAPFLKNVGDNVTGHDLDCGVFAISGNTFTVDGIPTLSPDAINGRKYEIALSNSSSESTGDETASKFSDSNKTSSKSGTSSDASTESKTSVGLKRSHSSDTTGTTKSNRDSGSKTEAGPRD